MSQSINRIQKRAKEIRKELWGAPIFFTLGVLVAEFAFSKIGDNFMYDIQTESLGKLPVYLLLGLFAGGLYMTVRFVAEKNRTRVSVKDIVSHSDGIRFLYEKEENAGGDNEYHIEKICDNFWYYRIKY